MSTMQRIVFDNITFVFDEQALVVRFPKGREDIVAGAVVVSTDEFLQVLCSLFAMVFGASDKYWDCESCYCSNSQCGICGKKWWATW